MIRYLFWTTFSELCRCALRLRLGWRWSVPNINEWILSSMGSHLLLHWSGTLQVVALSLADAELHGFACVRQRALPLRNICGERNMSVPLQLITDASAATGVIQHQCAEMIKHLDIKTLWLGDFAMEKIPRLAKDLERHLENSSFDLGQMLVTHFCQGGCCSATSSLRCSPCLLSVPQHPSPERPETLNLEEGELSGSTFTRRCKFWRLCVFNGVRVCQRVCSPASPATPPRPTTLVSET